VKCKLVSSTIHTNLFFRKKEGSPLCSDKYGNMQESKVATAHCSGLFVLSVCMGDMCSSVCWSRLWQISLSVSLSFCSSLTVLLCHHGICSHLKVSHIINNLNQTSQCHLRSSIDLLTTPQVLTLLQVDMSSMCPPCHTG
jgi:hypothetical protein